MSGSKQKSYNDHELCEDIAGGILTQKQIAEKHDLSPQMVSDIARGDKRTDLKPIIDKISESYIAEVRRIARARGRKTMRRLDEIVDGNGGKQAEVSLKAIKHVHAISGVAQTEETAGDLRAVVIKTPFAIDPTKIKSNGKGGNGKKNNKGGNGKKNNRKKNSDKGG